MQLADIRTDARFLISPQLTSTEYPDVDLDRNANRWYRTFIGWIIPIQGDWEIGGDIIYRDFMTAVTDYALPSKLLRIYKGEVMYATGGEFVPLDFINVQRDQALVEGNTTRTRDDSSQPTAEIFGDILQIRPATDEDVVNGIKLWAQMDLVDLDNTNDLPDLMEPVQRGLSIGSAMDYAIAEGLDKKVLEMKRLMYGDSRVPDDKGIKGMIENLYAARSGAKRQRLVASKRTRYN